MLIVCSLAPVDAPQNVTATSNTATSITVCFEFPEGSTQNGQLTSFNVTLVGTPFDTDSQTVSIDITSTEYPLTGSLCDDVNNLEEFNNYNITSLILINSASDVSTIMLAASPSPAPLIALIDTL